MDVSKAVDELENCSLIEVIGGSSVADQFLRVPLAASIFGGGKLAVNSARTAIEVDTGYLRMFGAARIGGVEKGLSPRVDRLVASISNQMERGQDVTQEVAILEFVARDFPPAWFKLAELYEENNGQVSYLSRAKESMEHYLQKVPNDRDAWWRLSQICQRQNDGLGELQALLQRAQLSGTTVYDLSHVANRFNSLISVRSVDLVGDEKRMMAERIRRLLEQRLNEADATVLSRLAWLCLHLGDDTAALQYAQKGLGLEPQNSHCQKLVERIRA
jgi:tetratricopeptide (TPR) repeat protein